ncbi:DsbA family protein [Tepidiforma sp.]|uniref:DsbA family protein n=1 Tax=Tepidiforma sp. TaxID=2682230 RepID=UPI002ADE030E|nr:thioredoxin domain-containing protein [Tepidiforma sp.]
MFEPNPGPEPGPIASEEGTGRPVYLRRQPIWSYFLTPAAILVGALVIAGAIWWTDDDAANAPAAGGSAAAPGGASTPPPASPTTAARGLLDTFLAYAASLQLEQQQLTACLNDQANVQLINSHLQRGSQLGVSGTPTFFINNKKLVGAQPTEVMLEIIEKELSSSPPTGLDAYSPRIQQLAASSPPAFEIVEARPDLAGAAFEGNPNARVVIAEFSDFQCPFCRRWNETTLGEVRKRLGDDLALAFLHFPITQIHPNAGNASLLAICAGRQGKFWEMHDLLFARQDEWSNLR